MIYRTATSNQNLSGNTIHDMDSQGNLVCFTLENSYFFVHNKKIGLDLAYWKSQAPYLSCAETNEVVN